MPYLLKVTTIAISKAKSPNGPNLFAGKFLPGPEYGDQLSPQQGPPYAFPINLKGNANM